ncbi:MAG TPA: NAD(P)/FAD-dependent oxidoreductase [Vicinamibacterales bacterium]|jgi:phytoene dehydrogenase-like protein|nr:NAD(P)/FAD-dependent oxidoreductase [Vicinamibacterales bacterium]HJO37022.1 NAD(P)/FAD-dependent oxidoreductase [Vicinamibacterales bacterium]
MEAAPHVSTTVKPHDAVIIGAGHNGLVAAFYLARAGVRTLVLERRDVVGGAAVTDELCPGFRCPTLAHAAGPLHPDVAQDLAVHRHGIRLTDPDPRLFAPLPDGRALVLHTQAARSAAALGAFSSREGERYVAFNSALDEIGKVLRELLWRTPPSTDTPSANEVWQLLKSGRRFHGLGKQNAFRMLRWLAMPVADLVEESFDTDILRAIVAARGIYGLRLGTRSAGSGLALLLQHALSGHVLASAASARGGLGALTEGLAAAARGAGAEIRTAAAVERIDVHDGTARGVLLEDGTVIAASAVISGADPKRTFLDLLGPTDLDPSFVTAMQRYRSNGTMAKVNLALDGLPEFTALASSTTAERTAALGGRIHIGPDLDYLERAFDASKYGRYSERPYLDVTIPTVTDPTLAPDGQHVMSVCAQFAPYELRDAKWRTAGAGLGDAVIRELASYAPGLEDLVLHRQVLTPVDLEATYGLTGGQIFHGEHTLDQLFAMRPLLGWARYRTPISGLYLCSAGTHPGGGVTGACGLNASREILKDLGK